MIYWLLIVLTILCIVGFAICDGQDFWAMTSILLAFSIILLVITMICTIGVIFENTKNIEGQLEAKQMEYESLVYQYEHDLYNNDNDIGKKELMDEIKEWNSDVALGKYRQDNFWVGIFYADIYDQLEFIELK